MVNSSEETVGQPRHLSAADPYRPRYHFTAPSNWMNDPNGFIQRNGQYHLFYQHNPDGAFHAKIHWGHATSSDLVHWRDLPLALAPTPGGPDKDGCWSGCAVEHDGVPTLIYTGVFPECQCVAVGSDDMLSWHKFEGNPVIPAPPPELEVTGFRDPCVWHEGGTWYAMIGSGIAGVGGAILLYRSPDLIHWEYMHPAFVGDQNETGIMWECPAFFPLGDKYVLIVSVVPLAYVEYFVGTYRDFRFQPEFHQRLDYSGLFYAPQTILDEQGRRVMLGWLREARDTRYAIEARWSGMQSVPRLLSQRSDGRLTIEPVPELHSLRGEHHHLSALTVKQGSSNLLPGVSGRALEIRVVFALETAPCFGLKLFVSPDDAEQTVLAFDRGSQTLSIDRSRSTAKANGVDISPQIAQLVLASDETLDLIVYLDGSTVEVFANGHTCLTSRVYPTRPDSTGIDVFAVGGSVAVRRLDVWLLDPA